VELVKAVPTCPGRALDEECPFVYPTMLLSPQTLRQLGEAKKIKGNSFSWDLSNLIISLWVWLWSKTANQREEIKQLKPQVIFLSACLYILFVAGLIGALQKKDSTNH
jgi:hypothetical protein